MQQGARRPLVAGNWKMHGSLAEARARARAVVVGRHVCEVAIAPPFVHLAAVAAELAGSPVLLAAQDASAHDAGAHTGEVSAPMLLDAGCRLVLVGHSERRHGLGETDGLVAAKFVAVQRAGLVPVLCVGETLAEREAGRTSEVVLRQLDAVLAQAGGFGAAVLAYEPVWAIGTGRNATAEQAQEVHALLRAQLARRDAAAAQATRILYGGSVKAANAGTMFAMPDVDGALVGGASLDAREFLEICAQAQ
ncbi:MAG: triose-phosphate isomerase [Pseudomonadota bacterium]